MPEYFDPTIDYYVFTDNADLVVYEPFKKVVLDKFEDDPVRIARRVKLNPFTLLKGYDYAIWVDASFLVRNSLEPYVSKVERANADLGAFPHPDRTRYEAEVEACIRKGKDDVAVIRAQQECYASQHDIDAINMQPLLVTGILIANLKSPVCRSFFEVWDGEVRCFSRRDQLSSSFALNEVQPTYVLLETSPDLAHLNNKYMFEIYDHSSETGYVTPKYLPKVTQIDHQPGFGVRKGK